MMFTNFCCYRPKYCFNRTYACGLTVVIKCYVMLCYMFKYSVAASIINLTPKSSPLPTFFTVPDRSPMFAGGRGKNYGYATGLVIVHFNKLIDWLILTLSLERSPFPLGRWCWLVLRHHPGTQNELRAAVCDRCGTCSNCRCSLTSRSRTNRHLTARETTRNESAPIQLAQCLFAGLAITNAKTHTPV